MSKRNRTSQAPPPTVVAPPPQPVEPPQRATLLAVAICVLATVATMAPFVTRAFNIDDTLFLYAAKRITIFPADPYGFVINWYGNVLGMPDVTQNPPLACYFIALAATCVGWSEAALHMAFMIPAAAAVLGTYFLALRFCGKPLLAALMTLLCPVFMVSSLTVMCDVLMLAFWVWAILLWLRGMDHGNHLFFILSACCIAAGALTKYFAIALVPLLLAYSLLRWRRVGWRILYFLIPIAAVLVYDAITRSLYDVSMFFGAGSYALGVGAKTQYSARLLMALSFTGGCFLMMLFYVPLLWSRWGTAVGVGAAGILCLLFSTTDRLGKYRFPTDPAERFLLDAHFAVFVVLGVSVLALAVADLKRRRDAESLLLMLWIAGTFLFCWLLNWTINGRSILPMTPAVAILIVRRIQQCWPDRSAWRFRWELAPVAVTGLLALVLTWADMKFANSERDAADEFHKMYGGQEHRVRFEGHWGFQYYMESLGFKPYELETRMGPGALLILPENNTNVHPEDQLEEAARVELPSWPFATTMSSRRGAGFYASVWGPLPFAFGPAPDERYHVMMATEK